MGTPDTYGRDRVQLKTGPCECRHFYEGDDVAMGDGVYVGHEGVVVVMDSKILATFSFLMDKWGMHVDPASVLIDRDEVAAKVRRLVKSHGKPKKRRNRR